MASVLFEAYGLSLTCLALAAKTLAVKTLAAQTLAAEMEQAIVGRHRMIGDQA